MQSVEILQVVRKMAQKHDTWISLLISYLKIVRKLIKDKNQSKVVRRHGARPNFFIFQDNWMTFCVINAGIHHLGMKQNELSNLSISLVSIPQMTS